MAMGSMDIAAITRSQDYTTIKHNEDNKGIAQQANLVHNKQREVEDRLKQVNEGDNTAWQNKKFDAKEKGNNSYSGNGGSEKKKKQEPDGRVVLKGQNSFDIKI